MDPRPCFYDKPAAIANNEVLRGKVTVFHGKVKAICVTIFITCIKHGYVHTFSYKSPTSVWEDARCSLKAKVRTSKGVNEEKEVQGESRSLWSVIVVCTPIIEYNMHYIDVGFKMFTFRNQKDTEIVIPREDTPHTDHVAIRTQGAS